MFVRKINSANIKRGRRRGAEVRPRLSLMGKRTVMPGKKKETGGAPEEEKKSRRANAHKLALLYTMKYLQEESDEEHPVNASAIVRYLTGLGVAADRRTIYADVEVLTEFGLDIIKTGGGKSGGYYLAAREFELPELKLLVDAVQSSRFITEKKSAELIRKLSSLTSRDSARELSREVFIQSRIKTENENIFYSIDCIYEAMRNDRQVAFRYGTVTPDKEMVPRRGGARYQVSPWALIWSDENYYMIAYDDLAEKIKYYRVDKMLKPRMTAEKRDGAAHFSEYNPAEVARKTFGMFGGEEAQVTLRCENEMAGVVIDRFGSDVRIVRDGETHFKAMMTVAVSPQFFGWLTAVGKGIVLESPSSVKQAYRRHLRELYDVYGK